MFTSFTLEQDIFTNLFIPIQTGLQQKVTYTDFEIIRISF